ncbi:MULTISPECIES: hypothetical protein [unclassified Pseudoclavibacter]|uniref:hypothetical protein n=1 Tax=unclassified Pseudoclavibacter TaxID=2615177 RepID=UPI001BA6DEAC|nr:hypothetical protein [Pseudoclavibacter sp. Marseille-Q4354]MBS3177770.1 hypothetical protein [Pseudoclavibacter sp. Marseille-Q4354]
MYASFIDTDTTNEDLLLDALRKRSEVHNHAAIMETRRANRSPGAEVDSALLADLTRGFETSCAAMVESLGRIKSAAARVRTIGSTEVQAAILAYTHELAKAAAEVVDGTPSADVEARLENASTHSYALMYRDLGILTAEQRQHIDKRSAERRKLMARRKG